MPPSAIIGLADAPPTPNDAVTIQAFPSFPRRRNPAPIEARKCPIPPLPIRGEDAIRGEYAANAVGEGTADGAQRAPSFLRRQESIRRDSATDGAQAPSPHVPHGPRHSRESGNLLAGATDARLGQPVHDQHGGGRYRHHCGRSVFDDRRPTSEEHPMPYPTPLRHLPLAPPAPFSLSCPYDPRASASAADRTPPVGGSIRPQISLKTPRFGPELASSAAGAQE